MKSERRHQLQHNQLADALGDWTVRLKPYARLIGGLIILLLVAMIAYLYVSNRNQERIADGWDQYLAAFDAGDRTRLLDVAEKFGGTSVAPSARIAAADIALYEGCQGLFRNKSNGREALGQAVNNYQTVLAIAEDQSFKQRALFGLGRAHESLGALEDLNKAREDYKKLIAEFPDGVYTDAAKKRLADIDRNSTKEFYDWFAKYQPPMPTSPSAKKPEFIEESLDSEFKVPSILDDLNLNAPNTEPSKKGLNGLELPSTSTTDETPVEGDAPTTTPADSTEGKAVDPAADPNSTPSTPKESDEKSAK